MSVVGRSVLGAIAMFGCGFGFHVETWSAFANKLAAPGASGYHPAGNRSTVPGSHPLHTMGASAGSVPADAAARPQPGRVASSNATLPKNAPDTSNVSKAAQRQVGSAMAILDLVLQKAEAADRLAQGRLDQASAAFVKAREFQLAADSAAKAAANTEAHLIESRAKALRAEQHASEMTVAAERVGINTAVRSSEGAPSPVTLNVQAAKEATSKVEHDMNEIQSKLVLAEPLAAQTAEVAENADQAVATAKKALNEVTAEAIKASAERTKIEEQVRECGDTIAELAEKFEIAKHARNIALQDYIFARDALDDAVRSVRLPRKDAGLPAKDPSSAKNASAKEPAFDVEG